jgi:hypothetical protein
MAGAALLVGDQTMELLDLLPEGISVHSPTSRICFGLTVASTGLASVAFGITIHVPDIRRGAAVTCFVLSLAQNAVYPIVIATALAVAVAQMFADF